MSEGCIPTVSPSVCRRQTSPPNGGRKETSEKRKVYSLPLQGEMSYEVRQRGQNNRTIEQ